MSRYQNYRVIRWFRYKILAAAIVSIAIAFSGIIISDRSYNSIVSCISANTFFELEPSEKGADQGMVLDIFNMRIRIGTQYVQRDIRKLMDFLLK